MKKKNGNDKKVGSKEVEIKKEKQTKNEWVRDDVQCSSACEKKQRANVCAEE